MALATGVKVTEAPLERTVAGFRRADVEIQILNNPARPLGQERCRLACVEVGGQVAAVKTDCSARPNTSRIQSSPDCKVDSAIARSC